MANGRHLFNTQIHIRTDHNQSYGEWDRNTVYIE